MTEEKKHEAEEKTEDQNGETAVSEEKEAVSGTEEAAETEKENEGSAEETGAVTEESQETEEERLRRELEHEQNKYLRLLADYENFKRRTAREREEGEKFRSRSLLSDLLPVLDNFERALMTEAKSEEAESLMKGVRMVYNALLDAVKREGLEEVETVGKPFDPNFHQAVMQEKDESKEAGTVLQELQKGYVLNGRVLRPAMVKVNE